MSHPFWKEIRRITKKRTEVSSLYIEAKRLEDKLVFEKVEICKPSDFNMNIAYKVIFAPLSRSRFVNNDNFLIHGDSIKIIEAQSDKIIAFAKRYMAYAGSLAKFSGNQPKFDFKLGYKKFYSLDLRVLFAYTKGRLGHVPVKSEKLEIKLYKIAKGD